MAALVSRVAVDNTYILQLKFVPLEESFRTNPGVKPTIKSSETILRNESDITDL